MGTVWGLPILLPQYPRLTGTTDILAWMMAPRMAVATCQHSKHCSDRPLPSSVSHRHTYLLVPSSHNPRLYSGVP